MKKILALFLFAFASLACMAQPRDPVSHSSSSLGGQARYEMVQSALAARWTFRLDRVCGNISQVVLTQSESMTFETMLVLGLPKCVPDGKIRYQLFTSGLAARHTYLLNTESGKAWQIQSLKNKDGNEFYSWVAFDE
jgi:hypothetical protein